MRCKDKFVNALSWVVAALLTVGVMGCQTLVDSWIDQAILDTIPAVLGIVMVDPSQYSEDDHPLEDVEVGTVIDNLKNLDGRWGRHTEIIENFMNKYEVIEFDPDKGVFHHYYIVDFPEIFHDDAPSGKNDVIVIRESKYWSLSQKRIRVTETNVLSGYVDEDGVIRSTFGGAFSGFLQLAKYDMMLTVDGDYLKVQRTGVGQLGPSDQDIELWKRIEEIEEDDSDSDE